MAISRDELKKKRLQAMGVVGEQMQASAEMYDRVIVAGSTVAAARSIAEDAHMGALQEQVADLNEMAEDMAEFAQEVPSNGGGSGTKSPAKATVAPSVVAGRTALDALLATQPNPPAKTEGEKDGNAYKGTSPPKL
jgi:hypothetical protein